MIASSRPFGSHTTRSTVNRSEVRRDKAVVQYARRASLPRTIGSPTTARAVGLVKTTSSWKWASTCSMSRVFQASAHRAANARASSVVTGAGPPIMDSEGSHALRRPAPTMLREKTAAHAAGSVTGARCRKSEHHDSHDEEREGFLRLTPMGGDEQQGHRTRQEKTSEPPQETLTEGLDDDHDGRDEKKPEGKEEQQSTHGEPPGGGESTPALRGEAVAHGTASTWRVDLYPGRRYGLAAALLRGQRRAVPILSCVFLSAIGVAAADDGLSAPSRTARLAIERAAPGRLPWVVFDERSGLPQHTIVDLLTDQRGFVWAATQDGIARYDGRSWVPMSLPRAMGSNYPRTMRAARDGGLWIGSFDGGLAHLRDGQWTLTGTREGLPSNRIRGLLETTDASGESVLWIATDHGVARRARGRLDVFAEESGLPSLDTEGLCETALLNGERVLVVGTTNGLARFTGDRFVPVPVPRQVLGHRLGDVVESAGLGGRPALWVTSYGAGMAVLEGGEWTVIDTSSGLPSNVEVLTKSKAEDGSPALWIGTEGGLLRFERS